MKNTMKKYYLNAMQIDNMNAGSKAVNDACNIFEKNGYERLLPEIKVRNKYLRFLVTYLISFQVGIRILLLPKNTTIILNFPPVLFFERVALLMLKKRSKVLNVILLIHDIYELRLGADNQTRYRNLKNYRTDDFNYICHNKIMEKWLIDEGYNKDRVVSLDIFDYLTPEVQESKSDYNGGLIIAGNLSSEKSKYLMKLSDISSLNFNLYGPNLSKEVEDNENVKYFGSFPSDEIPQVITGSYGIVWDSDALKGGEGKYGNYQRYNNPHKTSLYLAAGFPIILWSESALAPLIQEKKLGIAVQDLRELPVVLDSLTKNEYNAMRNNVLEIGEKIREGYFLTQAIEITEKNILLNNTH